METIISYIDNLFRAYPDTPKVRKARAELLGIMEDKYHELKAEGKSENEAIGIVISEFGSMEEIAFELGLDEEKKGTEQTFEDAIEKKRISQDEAEAYIKEEESFGVKIGIGVALCILSPVPVVVAETLQSIGLMAVNISDTFGAVTLFFLVAVAVGIFIISGISHSKYEEYEKSSILLDSRTRMMLEQQYESYHQIFGIKVAVGVALCILSVIPVVLIEGIFEHTSFGWLSELSAVSLFAFVAGGVYLFITTGMKHGAYETLLGKGKKRVDKKTKKKDKWISVVAAIYWPIMAAIYLSYSFVTMDWGRSWMIWPVSGIIFGGISAAMSLIIEK